MCSIVVATWESGGDGISIVGIGTSSEGMGWGWGRCLLGLVGMGTKYHTRAKLYVKILTPSGSVIILVFDTNRRYEITRGILKCRILSLKTVVG